MAETDSKPASPPGSLKNLDPIVDTQPTPRRDGKGVRVTEPLVMRSKAAMPKAR